MENRSLQQTPEFLEAFGKRLRALRKERGLSIKQAVEKLGIPRSTYASWELGKRYPLGTNMVALCDMLDTTEGYLSGRITNKTNDLKDLLDVQEVVFDNHILTEKEIELTTIFLQSLISNNNK